MPISNGPFYATQISEAWNLSETKATQTWNRWVWRLDALADWCAANNRADLWFDLTGMLWKQAEARRKQQLSEKN